MHRFLLNQSRFLSIVLELLLQHLQFNPCFEAAFQSFRKEKRLHCCWLSPRHSGLSLSYKLYFSVVVPELRAGCGRGVREALPGFLGSALGLSQPWCYSGEPPAVTALLLPQSCLFMAAFLIPQCSLEARSLNFSVIAMFIS